MNLFKHAQTIVPASDSPIHNSLPVDPDMTLLESARNLDRDSLIQIFDQYATRLYRYALSLCRDQLVADQIVGDVFARLLEELSGGRGPQSNLRAYLYRMTYHRFIDETRHSKRIAPIEAVDGIRYDDSPVSGVEDRLMFEAVMQAVQTVLTSDQQNVIVLRFLEGLSLSDTALIMGKRVNHVKVLQTRALQRLRKALQDRRKKEFRSNVTGHDLSDVRYEFAI